MELVAKLVMAVCQPQPCGAAQPVLPLLDLTQYILPILKTKVQSYKVAAVQSQAQEPSRSQASEPGRSDTEPPVPCACTEAPVSHASAKKAACASAKPTLVISFSTEAEAFHVCVETPVTSSSAEAPASCVSAKT